MNKKIENLSASERLTWIQRFNSATKSMLNAKSGDYSEYVESLRGINHKLFKEENLNDFEATRFMSFIKKQEEFVANYRSNNPEELQVLQKMEWVILDHYQTNLGDF